MLCEGTRKSGATLVLMSVPVLAVKPFPFGFRVNAVVCSCVFLVCLLPNNVDVDFEVALLE